jgi:hypothetical protein
VTTANLLAREQERRTESKIERVHHRAVLRPGRGVERVCQAGFWHPPHSYLVQQQRGWDSYSFVQEAKYAHVVWFSIQKPVHELNRGCVPLIDFIVIKTLCLPPHQRYVNQIILKMQIVLKNVASSHLHMQVTR